MINITAFNGKTLYGVYNYILDYMSDLPSLYYKVSSPGSEAYCIENMTTYIFGSDNTWKEKSNPT